MSIDLKQILGIVQKTNLNDINVSDLLASVAPKVVIEAPNGQKLYIDVSPSPSGETQSTPLWPAGFKLGFKTGSVPADPLATASPTQFFLDQSPTILTAPGPLGISWGTWVLAMVAIIIFPFLTYHVFKKS